LQKTKFLVVKDLVQGYNLTCNYKFLNRNSHEKFMSPQKYKNHMLLREVRPKTWLLAQLGWVFPNATTLTMCSLGNLGPKHGFMGNLVVIAKSSFPWRSCSPVQLGWGCQVSFSLKRLDWLMLQFNPLLPMESSLLYKEIIL
jgi:hypothetical protein